MNCPSSSPLSPHCNRWLTVGGELVHATVLLVHDVQVVVGVYGQTGGTVQLSVVAAALSPFVLEYAPDLSNTVTL